MSYINETKPGLNFINMTDCMCSVPSLKGLYLLALDKFGNTGISNLTKNQTIKPNQLITMLRIYNLNGHF